MIRIIISILIIFFLLNCQKEKDNCEKVIIPEYNEFQGNRVIFDPGFRIGTWVNITKNVTNIDTIIFHNDSVWSNFNSSGGIKEGKYEFIYQYLASYMDYSGNVLDVPFEKAVLYNDTTGVFSIRVQNHPGYERWHSYIKIK